jgi:hypothetical protein
MWGDLEHQELKWKGHDENNEETTPRVKEDATEVDKVEAAIINLLKDGGLLLSQKSENKNILKILDAIETL